MSHFWPFLSPWIRIPNMDPDPEDPWIRIRILNTVKNYQLIKGIFNSQEISDLCFLKRLAAYLAGYPSFMLTRYRYPADSSVSGRIPVPDTKTTKLSGQTGTLYGITYEKM